VCVERKEESGKEEGGCVRAKKRKEKPAVGAKKVVAAAPHLPLGHVMVAFPHGCCQPAAGEERGHAQRAGTYAK
jgi:hypothetical protein